MQADKNLIAALESLIDQYEKEVEQAPYTEKTKRTYIYHSRNFVRWVKGDFSLKDSQKLHHTLKR